MDKLSAPDHEPILYIVMRDDLASLNPGKACAQAAHAANRCVQNLLDLASYEEKEHGKPYTQMLAEWEGDRGFGTCIVLSGPLWAIKKAFAIAADNLHVYGGIITDPTYPIQDGEFTHYIPVETCGYIFGRLNETVQFVADFRLMP